MQIGGCVSGFLFSDFSFIDDNNQVVPGQNGPFTLPGGATAILAPRADRVLLETSGEDGTCGDGFHDMPAGTPLKRTITSTIVATGVDGGFVTFMSGEVAKIEFVLTATPVGGGPSIELLFVAIGPDKDNGNLQFVTSKSPITPGVAYNISCQADGDSASYVALICFTSGTQIAKPTGDVAVETLLPGDEVIVADGSAARITWVGSRLVSVREQRKNPALRPIRFRKGAMGNGLPHRDLIVSRQHRVVLNAPRLALLFDNAAVLATAGALVNNHTVQTVEARAPVRYHHIMFSKREIIRAEGLLSESFDPRQDALDALGDDERDDFLTLFPEIRNTFGSSALPMARNFEVQALTRALAPW